jgi:hypothetical protein
VSDWILSLEVERREASLNKAFRKSAEKIKQGSKGCDDREFLRLLNRRIRRSAGRTSMHSYCSAGLFERSIIPFATSNCFGSLNKYSDFIPPKSA